jgi:beta-glucosidase
LQALRERQIQPFVTLLHYTQPLWFMAKGGWLADDSPRLFERFVTRTVDALSDLANFWITLNEPNLYIILNYAWKGRPPGAGSLRQAFHVGKNLLRGHALAYHAIHRAQPTARVGLAYAWRWIAAANPRSALDRLSARLGDHITNRMFVRALTEGVFPFPIGRGEKFPLARNSLDYFALNYYFEHPVAFDLTKPGSLFARPVPADWVKDTEFEAYSYVGEWSSSSFYAVLKEISRFKLPIYVTENGVFDIGQDKQARYLVTHLQALHRALREGVEVRGYFWWTLVDNFEWDDGYRLRFGLYHLDVETQLRTPRPVAGIYAHVIRENGMAKDLIETYGCAD